jgi:hypothetical protein
MRSLLRRGSPIVLAMLVSAAAPDRPPQTKTASVAAAGRVVIEGPLTKQDVGTVVRKYLPRFRYCYDVALKQDPQFVARLAIEFEIDAKGAVAKPRIYQPTARKESFEACILKVTSTLLFPKPAGGRTVKVIYPFTFATPDRAPHGSPNVYDAVPG